MSEHLLRHDSGGATDLYDGALNAVPLSFDDDGEATVGSEALAQRLARRHSHVAYVGPLDVVAEREGRDTDDGEAPFDPTEMTVDELRDRLDEADLSSADLEALAAAEEGRDGGPRTSALDAIESVAAEV